MVKNRYHNMRQDSTASTRYLMRTLIMLGLLISNMLLTSLAQAANITVTTSRNPVALDDSFHLIYEADSSVDDDPDFSPVYQYFDVLSSSQSTNMRSVNGSWSLKKTWDLSVIAKQAGKFTVPPISFGSDTSPAIRLTITNSTSSNSVSPNGQASIPAKIFLESSIDKKSGPVQSQFIYTIRLLRTVSIANASLTEPLTSDADAIIKPVSEDKYSTTRNGIRYEVFERKYAIFPQKSGSLTIKPITFEGRINATQSRSLFDQFRMSGQLKRLRSKAVKLTVTPAPASINLQDWLPASEVRLIEEWSDDIQNLKAGEPVTRTLLIAAEGLSSVQLPDLKFGDIDGIKQYPDKAVTEDKTEANGITGYKQIKVALIPARAGSYTLPEIKLQWWNTLTGKPELATLPAVNLTVSGTVIDDTPAPLAPAQSETRAPVQSTPTMQTTETPQTVVIEQQPYWQWLSFVFAGLWLITLFLLFKKSPDRQDKKPARIPSAAIKKAAVEVEKQAKRNNAHQTRSALIQWAQAFYGDDKLTNLGQLSARCSPQLATEIRQLNKNLYSPDQADWQGEKLLLAFRQESANGADIHQAQSSALKPLYGNSSQYRE